MLTDRKIIPAGRYHKNRTCMIVKYGLSNCAPGRQPYSFSVTGTIYRNASFNTDSRYFLSGGCIHEEIERCFKGKYTDLIAFHLRHENGEPIYPEANLYFEYQVCIGEQTWNNFSTQRALSWFANNLLLSEEKTLQLIERLNRSHDPKRFICKYIYFLRPMWKKAARDLKTKYKLPDFEIFD